MGILEETAKALQIHDFDRAAGQIKFEVYKLILKQLFMTLGRDPPREYLEGVRDDLNTMGNGLFELYNNGEIQNIDLGIILFLFNEAISYLKAALRYSDNSFEFFNYQGLCRIKINEINQHLS